uniref:Uncharacterized protein n=1 Tax=viral metagenome TaxID=1070528 RepID=A0A6C0HQ65_9ZZZZ
MNSVFNVNANTLHMESIVFPEIDVTINIAQVPFWARIIILKYFAENSASMSVAADNRRNSCFAIHMYNKTAKNNQDRLNSEHLDKYFFVI